MKAGWVWLGAVALASTVACGPREPDYEQTADEALSGAALGDAVEADYDSDARTIHLTGTVNSETDRQRAADVVQKAVGDAAQVANEVTVAGAQEEIADDLDNELETRLDELVDADTALNEQDVNFDVNNGVVTITGTVATREQRDKIGDLARSQPGVKDVVNSLEMKQGRTGGARR